MNPQDDLSNLSKPQASVNNTTDLSISQSSPSSAAADTPEPPSSNPAQAAQSEQTFTEIALPADAEDTDLIEKEWVERAKQIVEHTKEDPYEQQRALSHMKADYLKKRYGKDIKVTDD